MEAVPPGGAAACAVSSTAQAAATSPGTPRWSSAAESPLRLALVAASGRGAGTIDFRTDYLRPATGPHLDAVAVVRRAGRTLGVADVDVLDENGRLVAAGRGSFFMERE